MHFLLSGRGRSKALTIFNRVLIDRRVAVEKSFVCTVTSQYGSHLIVEADFKTDRPRIVRESNLLVKRLTRGKISNLLSLDDVSSNSSLLLVNVIHFKSGWQDRFDVRRTALKPFTTLDGQTVPVPMMCGDILIEHFSVKELSAVATRLFFRDNTMNLVILSPEHSNGFLEMEELLYKYNGSLNERLSSKFDGSTASNLLCMPKFEIGNKLDIKEDLSALGIEEAFSKRANFGGISTSRKVFISNILHQARFKLDEEGAEASAATVGSVQAISALNEVVIDHPFVFMILSRATNSIVFMGRVVDPRVTQ